MDRHGHASHAQRDPLADPHPPAAPGPARAAHAALRAAVPVTDTPPAPPAPRKRRVRRLRSAHPGVVLLPPHGRHGWRARYRDPISGRRKKVTLSHVDAANEKTRTRWACAMSDAIAVTLRDRALGVRAPVDVTVDDAITRWIASDAREASTVRTYRTAVDEFRGYVGAARYCREIDLPMVEAYRIAIRSRKAQRGARRPLSLFTLNGRFRTLICFLRWARLAAGCPMSTDDIARALRPFRVKVERKEFLPPPAIARLLELADRYEPHMYWPIRTALFTGLRAGELIALRWEWITEGDRIQLPGAATKGGHVRDVDLTVTALAIPPRRRGATGRLFPALKYPTLQSTLQRLRERDPEMLAGLTAHMLRRTTATYFTNAFNAWRSAKSLGHSVVIAERHYAGLIRVPAGCRTLEQAMGLEGTV